MHLYTKEMVCSHYQIFNTNISHSAIIVISFYTTVHSLTLASLNWFIQRT